MESFHPVPFNNHWVFPFSICCCRCPDFQMQMPFSGIKKSPTNVRLLYVWLSGCVFVCLRVYLSALWIYFWRKIRWKYYVTAATFSDNHIYKGVSARRLALLKQPGTQTMQSILVYTWNIGSYFGQPSALFMPPTAYVHCLANKAKRKQVKTPGKGNFLAVYGTCF